MKKLLLFILFTALPLSLTAQTYSWQWAKQGGGDSGSSNVGFSALNDEYIRDVVIDSNNNSYYLSAIYLGNPKLNGTPITVYDNSDLFLYSTDCQGNIRWSRTIGGNGAKSAWKLAVDSNGGLFLTAVLYNGADTSSPTSLPIRFGDNDALPKISTPYSPTSTVVDPGLNSSFLLKYNTSDGTLAWRKNLQGGVSWQNNVSDNSLWYMDINKDIHAILGFEAGTHLDGLITVPGSFTNEMQYYLVKFNYNNGNMTPAPNPILLPITGTFYPSQAGGKGKLLFDEILNRYYITGARDADFTGSYSDIAYNNVPFTKDGYMFAFDGTNGAELWRKEFQTGYQQPDNKIYGLIKDANSNIYISGYYYWNAASPATTFGNYTFPTTSNGYTPFIIKMNPAGIVQWAKIPDGLSPNNTVGYRFARSPIVLNGNEIAFVKGSRSDIWGSFAMVRPQNDDSDPLLVRLNKDTGTVIGTNEIRSDGGQKDEMTAVAVDQDGNYVVGGFFSNQLFTDANDGIPTITSSSISGKSNFFAAKLAKSACSPLSTTEVSVKDTDMQFYPNPVDDVLTIKTKESLKTYEVISAVGQQVQRGSFSGNNYTISMQGLTKGVYFVKVFTDKVSVVEKVVKK